MDIRLNYYELIKKDFQTIQYKKYDIVCTNSLNKFRTSNIEIQKNNDLFKLIVFYRVIHCDFNCIFKFVNKEPFESIESLMDFYFNLLWTYTICNECFELIPVDPNYTICIHCIPMRIYWEFGLQHDKTISVPQCSICFDPVYHSHLECKHYFHKNCIIQMNKNSWYYGEEISCPVCRSKLSTNDKYHYFLWNHEGNEEY